VVDAVEATAVGDGLSDDGAQLAQCHEIGEVGGMRA
jgi:hypothetical protein